MNYQIEQRKNGVVVTFAKAPPIGARKLLTGLGYRYNAVKKCWFGRKYRELLEALFSYERELEDNHTFVQSKTICWDCANTNDTCTWFSREQKPVDGWDAEYNERNGSYTVNACPNFQKNDRTKNKTKVYCLEENEREMAKIKEKMENSYSSCVFFER